MKISKLKIIDSEGNEIIIEGVEVIDGGLEPFDINKPIDILFTYEWDWYCRLTMGMGRDE